MCNYKEIKKWSNITKTDPEKAMKYVIDKSLEYPKMDNKFEAKLICQVLIQILNTLPEEFKNKISNDVVLKIHEDFKNFNSQISKKDEWELVTKESWKNSNSNIKYKNTEKGEWLPYVFAHNTNLKMVQNLLKKCRSELNKLRVIKNKVETILNKKNKNDDDIFIYGVKEITCIAAMLRKCIEIVVWWWVRYNKKNIDINLKDYMSYEVFNYYIENDLGNFDINTIDVEKSDFNKLEFVSKKCKLWEIKILKDVCRTLSNYIHYDIVGNSKFLSFYDEEYLNVILTILKNDLNFAYDYFLNLINTINDSLINHLIYFDNKKCFAIVKNFKIDYENFFTKK